MRVREVRSYVIGYPDPNDSQTRRMTVLVRVETTDGVVGWGEGIAMWPEACKAAALIARDGLFPLIKDQSPSDIERHWHAMRRHAWWYGKTGIANFAKSAIDIALWDIKGKIAGKPVSDLLGGLVKDRLPANASTHVNQPTIEASVADYVKYAGQGFRSVKLGFGKPGQSKVGKDPDHDVLFIRELRAALGPNVEIMVDVGNGVTWDVATAIKTTRRMEEYNIAWIEEPLYPSDIRGYKQLRAAVHTPIASGEREWSVEAYAALLETDTVDIFGIDPARAEGLTGFVKAAAMITAARRTVNAHAWSTAITTAASLHASLCTPASRLFEFKPIPGPMQFELVDAPIWHEDGWAKPLTAPGLGVDVKEDIVRKYQVEV